MNTVYFLFFLQLKTQRKTQVFRGNLYLREHTVMYPQMTKIGGMVKTYI